MTTDERAREVLREHGLRGTGQRLAILRLLAEAGSGHDEPHLHNHDTGHDGAGHDHRSHTDHGHPHGHLSVTEIHERLARDGTHLDVTTVYRTLTTLEELGIVHVIAVGTDAATYGLSDAAHHHAVCTRCGSVVGIAADDLASAFAAIERATGFPAASCALTVHGTCRDCS